MTDRLTPGQLRDLADLTANPYQARKFNQEAARREAEGFVPEAARQAVAVAAGLTSAPPIPDAPPPSAPDRERFLEGQNDRFAKSLEAAISENATLTLRAEAAEAREKRLRDASKKAVGVLARAFDRIHCLPRTSDTELANDISATMTALAQEGTDG